MTLLHVSGPADSGGKRVQALSLNAFLTRLIWLCVLPLVVLAVYLAVKHVHTLQDEQDQQAANQAHNIATTLDQHIAAQIAGLQMLAASPLANDPSRWNEFYDEARGFGKSFGGEVILADLSMQMLLNTREPFGATLPKLPVPKGHAAAPTVLATGKPAVSDMFLGPIARQPLVAVAVPVIRDSQTKFLLLSTMETHQFQQRLDEVALPAGWSLSVLDGKDEVMARRAPTQLEGRQADNEPHGGFVAKCAASHWSVVLEVPRSVYQTPIAAAIGALTAAILAVTLLSVLGGRLAGRRLAHSVAALARTPSPPTSRPVIAEIEAVRSLLDDAAAARESAELKRGESEERFRQLFDIAPVPLASVNRDGVLVSSNARFTQIFGYERKDVPTLSEWWRLAYPDPGYRQWVVETWEAAMLRARENNTDIEPIEYNVTCRNGKVLTVVISGTILGDDFLATFFDVTERKQAEEALKESEAHYRFLFENMLNGYAYCKMHFDQNGPVDFTYISVNDAFEALTGLKDVVGKRVSEVIPGIRESDPELLEIYGRVALTGAPERFETYVESLKMWFSISVYSPRKEHFVAVFDVITERKQAEQELRNSLEEKVALLKEVHHRVKNNLQIVASLLNLQAGRSRNRQVVDVLQDTRNRVHSMALLHEVLYRSGNLARINFAAYVRELCTQLTRSFGSAAARVKVESRIAQIGLPLEQSVPCGLIINELVSNALKHGFPDKRPGKVAVELDPTEGQRLLLCVRDDGVGLPPGLDIAGKSTLGLQLASNLAIQLGGQLETHPSDGGGSVFRVSFPIPENTTVREDEA